MVQGGRNGASAAVGTDRTVQGSSTRQSGFGSSGSSSPPPASFSRLISARISLVTALARCDGFGSLLAAITASRRSISFWQSWTLSRACRSPSYVDTAEVRTYTE